MADPSWLPQVKAVFDNAGIPPEVWIPIMLHESGANPGAQLNTIGKPTAAGISPEWSVGLFQINVHAKGLTPDAEAALAAKLTDPVYNAQYAVVVMAPAWAAVKDQAAKLNPNTWPGLVGVRSGWPAGSITNPCTSAYCNNIQSQFAQTAATWQAALNAPGNVSTDLIAPFFGFTPSANTGNGTGQSASNSVTTAPGYPPAGNSAGTPAAPGAASTPASGVDVGGLAAGLFQAVDNQAHADFSAWLRTPAAADTLFFVMGFLLVLIGVAALLFEQQQKAAPEIVKLTKEAVAA